MIGCAAHLILTGRDAAIDDLIIELGCAVFSPVIIGHATINSLPDRWNGFAELVVIREEVGLLQEKLATNLGDWIDRHGNALLREGIDVPYFVILCYMEEDMRSEEVVFPPALLQQLFAVGCGITVRVMRVKEG